MKNHTLLTYLGDESFDTGDSEEEFKIGKDAQVVVDSGTSYMLMPMNDMNKFLKFLKGKGIDCYLYHEPSCWCY